MNTTEKTKSYLLLLGLIIIIGFPLYIIIKNNHVANNGIESTGTIINKEKVLSGKPISYRYYFTVGYKVKNKINISELSVDKNIYKKYKVKDIIYLLYDKKDINYIILNQNK